MDHGLFTRSRVRHWIAGGRPPNGLMAGVHAFTRYPPLLTSPPFRGERKKGRGERANTLTRKRANKARRQRGAILIGVLIILLAISLIGATLASFFLSVTIVAELELQRAQAFYLAEAGIAQAFHELYLSSEMGAGAQAHSKQVQMSVGTFEFDHDANTGLITSTGRVGDIRRTIQVKYLPF